MIKIWNKIKRGLSISLCTLLLVQSAPSICAMAEEPNDKIEDQLDVDNSIDYMGLAEFEATEIQVDEAIIAEHEKLVAEQTDEELQELVIQASGQASYWRKLGSNYIYDRLSNTDKAIWDELCAACEAAMTNGKSLSQITNTTPFLDKNWDYVSDFAYKFIYSNPQYFFLMKSISGYGMSNQYYININVFSEFKDGAARKTASEQFKSKIDSWIAEMNKYSLPVEKEKKAAEIICDNTIYQSCSLDQSAYSMVCQGKTVCAGYAATFSILMNAVGIETQVVSGMANNGQQVGSHGWNTVNLYGEWYLVDVTWMDSGRMFSLFNRSDATIIGNRVLDDRWKDYYYPAKYDAGSSAYTYVNPYFTTGNYMYFTVNNNTTCGSLLATPIAAINGASASGVPSTVTYNSKTYKVVGTLDSSSQPINPPTYVLGINKNTLALCVNDSSTLSVAYTPSKTVSGITWKSSDTSVATVDSSGKVKGVKAGTATISASDGSSTVKCTVAVSNHNYTSKIFTWNETNKTCKITYTCANNSAHTATYDCTVTSQLRKKATCVAKGTTRYFAKYGNDSTSVDYDDLAINPNAHGTTKLVNVVEVTSEHDGYTGDYVCELCNQIIQKGAVIPRSIIGWNKENDNWKYYDSESNAVTGWAKIGGVWYYFDSVGIMQIGWKKISEKWYYFGTNGAMSTGWKRIDGKWYYFGLSGAMNTGWKMLDEKWYYFGSSGAMTTGWQKINNKWYYFIPSGSLEGVMVVGWNLISGKWYYFEDGAMVDGWKLISSKWYYFDNGAMVTGTQKINGKTYVFDANGAWIR